MKIKPRWIFWLKLITLLGVVALVGWQLSSTWGQLAHTQLHLDWRYGIVGVLSFCASILCGGLVWRWLAWRMEDRAPLIRLLGAYTFSQVGKYVPGKVMLLFMRIERTRRFGMDATTCTISTLVENAMYLFSAALVAAATLLLYVHGHPAYIAGVVVMIAGLGTLFYPPLFYRLVNKMLLKAKKPAVPSQRQLPLRTLLLAVVMFLPCWVFGGVALWSAARCVTTLPMSHGVTFPGAFAFSVVGGMVMALAPGGLGAREAVLMLFLSPVLTPPVAGIVALIQRLFQIIAEGGLAAAGAVVTAGGQNAKCEMRNAEC